MSATSSGFSPEADPFGSAPARRGRGRGWLRLLLGVLLVAGGIVVLVLGIVRAVEAHGRIEDDAVARGTIRAGEAPRPVAFTVPAGERRDYTVYVLFEGLISDSEREERIVRDTGCVAILPDGARTRFSGAQQDVSMRLGGAASIGHFSAQPGPVRVACGAVDGARRSRPDALAFVVTPGRPSFLGSGVLTIIGGVALLLLGIALVIWGFVTRR